MWELFLIYIAVQLVALILWHIFCVGCNLKESEIKDD